MARSGSGAIVAGLTGAAVAVVAFLAYQASANATDAPVKGRPNTSASAPAALPEASAGPEQPKQPPAVPASSGSGRRVVYSLGAHRVWLVGADEQATRTFEVVPSTVSPAPGEYKVTSRTARIKGSDGVPVENVVRFTSVGNVVVGFSAAVDGSMPAPNPNAQRKTGGIRESREDGAAMWMFATTGTKVVVIG
ncbi:hypothetical protein [Streptomyces sp. URMC 123]|uniref:hypothetical protein n=1 Tax=Streptomyces sp. URMC 123 TaxID=3423403 RepID=UPI003F1CDF49